MRAHRSPERLCQHLEGGDVVPALQGQGGNVLLHQLPNLAR